MTDIAPHMTAYLCQRLPVERSASSHTCYTYAYAFQLLLDFIRFTHPVLSGFIDKKK